jgi:hypothetical protein
MLGMTGSLMVRVCDARDRSLRPGSLTDSASNALEGMLDTVGAIQRFRNKNSSVPVYLLTAFALRPQSQIGQHLRRLDRITYRAGGIFLSPEEVGAAGDPVTLGKSRGQVFCRAENPSARTSNAKGGQTIYPRKWGKNRKET